MCMLSMLLYSPNLYSPITFSDQFAKFNARQNNHVYGIFMLSPDIRPPSTLTGCSVMTFESCMTAAGKFLCFAFSKRGRVSSKAKEEPAGKVVDFRGMAWEDPSVNVWVCVCVCVCVCVSVCYLHVLCTETHGTGHCLATKLWTSNENIRNVKR